MLYNRAAIFLCLEATILATGRIIPLLQINNPACIAENLRVTERYICDLNGNVICIGGWSDPTKFCSVPTCELNGRDCINGNCVLPNVCVCDVGWDGPNCEVCIPLGGCKHGRCNRPMECNCIPGWTGGQCNKPECDGCVNGRCYEPKKCICDFGWTGTQCSECKTLRNCKNGRCVTHPFQCECYDGWQGIDCSKPICRVPCHPVNGYCDQPGECICHNGWSGRECEECVSYPGCNGTCVNNVPWTCSDSDTPVPGNPVYEWTTWNQWSTCSKSCGDTGIQRRERLCIPYSQGLTSHCNGEKFQTKKCFMKNCRMDGNWEIWTSWSPCSKSCGTGYKIRQRTCSNPIPKYEGTLCNGSSSEKSVCLSSHCPVDGRWSPWKSWGLCSVSCGEGTRSRSRSCDSPTPTHGGNTCLGKSGQRSSCNQRECTIYAQWSNWSNWTQCSKTCGQGQQHRIRECSKCLFGGWTNISNPTIEQESIPCWEQLECVIDGQWSTWSSWSQCTTSCGRGFKTQQRQCNDPTPKFGGQRCYGSSINRVKCNSNVDCTIDGKWNTWNPWSTCSTICSGGYQNRERACSPPRFGGKPCNGRSVQKRQCNNILCSVDGKWSLWRKWSSCSKTCKGGKRSRRRVCSMDNNGGKSCSGSKIEVSFCNKGKKCHIFGYWSRWTRWSECSNTCGNGSRTRNRICITNRCAGQKLQRSSCNEASCSVHGNWGKWTQWTYCTVSCGRGRKSRSRLCNNPSLQNGGNHCQGRALDSTFCSNGLCSIAEGHWGNWSHWSNCSPSCGKGVQRRKRQCISHRPNNNSKLCVGSRNQSRNCESNNCPIDYGFSEWTQWSKCSVDCIGDRGNNVRNRFCSTSKLQFGGRNCKGSRKEKRLCTGIFPKQSESKISTFFGNSVFKLLTKLDVNCILTIKILSFFSRLRTLSSKFDNLF
ncbi:SCO-spondin isoform X2 [Lepeophtheirus salmonis]|uniref:SCO-spondin isoform X2 n=1 Tax=Lepeophtheirus salmonis TaxID=72036 RepID=UPI001AE42560|nr:A disintegrin and metalloproteinase with thrombospondin motifs adt-1-like isoform X2 [Lepeophtheirus salmonis]